MLQELRHSIVLVQGQKIASTEQSSERNTHIPIARWGQEGSTRSFKYMMLLPVNWFFVRKK